MQDALGGSSEGFSLLELMAVLAIFALCLGLVLPGMYRAWERESSRAGVRELLVVLRTARSVAATQHQRVRVFLNLRSGSYSLEGSPRRGQLPPGMRLADAHLVWQDPAEARQGYIAFYADGSSSGGYLALLDSAGRRYGVDVEVITGKVSLKGG